MSNATLERPSTYVSPLVLSSSQDAPSRNDWVYIAMAVVLALAIFGSVAAACWAVCAGKVHSCSTGGPFWARTLHAVCYK